MSPEFLVKVLVLVPLFGAAVTGLFGRRLGDDIDEVAGLDLQAIVDEGVRPAGDARIHVRSLI